LKCVLAKRKKSGTGFQRKKVRTNRNDRTICVFLLQTVNKRDNKRGGHVRRNYLVWNKFCKAGSPMLATKVVHACEFLRSRSWVGTVLLASLSCLLSGDKKSRNPHAKSSRHISPSPSRSRSENMTSASPVPMSNLAHSSWNSSGPIFPWPLRSHSWNKSSRWTALMVSFYAPGRFFFSLLFARVVSRVLHHDAPACAPTNARDVATANISATGRDGKRAHTQQHDHHAYGYRSRTDGTNPAAPATIVRIYTVRCRWNVTRTRSWWKTMTACRNTNR